MFWFEKADPRAVFVDKRREICTETSCQGTREIVVNPDMISVLPFLLSLENSSMSFFANTEAQQPGEKRKLANISDDSINSNQQSVPVKYLAGRAYVAGDYISPAYNPKAIPITTQTGKGESQTTGYKYFADFALLFCMGGRRPVDAIYTIVVDSDIVWSGNVQRGNANKEVITVPDHGVIHLYWGGETQGVDSILLTARGTPGGGVDPKDNTTWPANSGRIFSVAWLPAIRIHTAATTINIPLIAASVMPCSKIGSSAAVAQACRTFSSS
jgi:hypothetical protein